MPNPTADFPLQLHNDTDISPFANTPLGATAPKHTQVVGKQEEEIRATQEKLGIGLSNAADATTDQVLQKQANGTTIWNSLTTGMVSEVADKRYLTDAQQTLLLNFTENVEDIIGTRLAAGTAISISYSDVTGLTTISVNQSSLSLTASQIIDFDTEVSNNTDVAANTAARHTHANKALLDTYTQTESNLANAVTKAHDAATVADTTTINLTLTGQQISGVVISQMSITADASGLKLSGDEASPGNSQYYGTDGSGTKGFFDLPSGGGAVDSVNGQTGVVVLDTDDIAEGSTNLYLTSERIDDRVATLIQNGTGISWAYDDTANTLTPTISLSPFSTTNLGEGTNLYYTAARFNTAFAAKSTSDLAEGSNLYFTNERVDDRVAALLTQGTGITLTYDDIAGTLTIATTITQYTDELAQDAVGGILADSSTINFTYTDGTPEITAVVIESGLNLANIGGTLDISGQTNLAVSAPITLTGDTIGFDLTNATYLESIDDRVAALAVAGTGMTVTYNDVANTLTFATTITQYTDEMARDAIGAALVGGTGITVTPNDGADTITIATTITQYTDEMSQDATATLIQNGTGITWSYNDGANTLTPTVSLSAFSTTNLSEGSNLYFTNERVDDRVAALLVQGTNITLTYDDTANTLTIAAASASPAGSDTYVQYNDGGTAFGGDATFTFNDSTKVLTFQEGITTGLRRSVDNAALAIFGGSAYDHGAYFNVTGKDYATFPGPGAAEFIIGQTAGVDGASSCFKLVSQDYFGNFTTRFRVEGSNGHVTIGLGTNAARFHHIGSADEIQSIWQAHSTQNENMMQFRNSSGTVQMAIAGNGRDFVLDTTTGSKIGTATTQKIGFWNATPVVQSTGWSVSNEVTDKSYDANSTTLDEIADVLGTLIETLKTYGILGA